MMKIVPLGVLVILTLLLFACKKEPISKNEEGLFIPSVFTPNQDGVNDVFYVQTTAATASTIALFKIIITDKDGYEVFVSTSLSAGWDGTDYVKQIVYPNGIYIYNAWFKFNDGTEERRVGTIELDSGQ